MTEHIAYRGPVTGLSFHKYARHMDDIRAGSVVLLARVSNPHDDYAVGVFFEGDQIGWVPKGQNQVVWKALGNINLTARVLQHDREAEFSKKLYIVTYWPHKVDSSISTQSQSQEQKMSKISIMIDLNKSAAASAAYSEAGRLANRKAKEVLAKKAPLMVRGYVDTPVGGLVIANLAVLAQQHFRPEDARLRRLVRAMQVQAYAELIQSFDVESFIDDLLSNATVKKALKSLPEDDEQ